MRATLGICLMLALSSPVVAQSDPALKAAAKARLDAQIAGDANEWGKYTTDDFVVIGVDGGQRTKQQRMTEIGGHPFTGPGPSISDGRWLVHGSTAIETFRFEARDGKAAQRTDVWVKEHGAWKVVLIQLTPITSQPSPP